MILPLYFFTLVFVAGPLIYMVALSFAQPGSGTSVEWNLTLEITEKFWTGLSSDLPGILSACPDQYGDHLSGGISFRVFYGKNV